MRAGHDGDRRRRRRVRDPRDPRSPGQADAAHERRREVVAVPFERESEREQLVGGQAPGSRRSLPPRGRARSSTRWSRGPGRCGMRSVKSKLQPSAGASSSNARTPRCAAVDGAVAGPELELVPEVERGAGAVEARADVRRRGRRADAEASSDRVGVLQAVAGDDADDPHVAQPGCLDRRDAGGARRLAEDALLARERAPRPLELGLGQRNDLPAGALDAPRRPPRGAPARRSGSRTRTSRAAAPPRRAGSAAASRRNPARS